MQLADLTLNIHCKAWAVAHLLAGVELNGDSKVHVKTSTWYNGREQGLCFSISDDWMEWHHIAVFEHRNGDSICALRWFSKDGYMNPPTIESQGALAYPTDNKHDDIAYSVKYNQAGLMAEWVEEKIHRGQASGERAIRPPSQPSQEGLGITESRPLGRKEMRFVKDQKVEANLKRLGIAYEVERVDMADIDLNEGVKRQTRLIGKLDDDYVLQLAIAMGQAEAAFPMPILQRPPRGKLWVWSGNHRLSAFQLNGGLSIECYTVKLSDPVMMDVLPRIVNAWESGLGFSKEERILNAKWLVEHHSMPAQEAADLLGIKPEWIITTKRAEEVRAKIADLGAKTKFFPKSTLIKMSPIKNTNVLKQVAKALIDYGVKGHDCHQLIADVVSKNTELQQQAELARWELHLKEKDKVHEPKTRRVMYTAVVRTNFLSKLGSLAKILERNNTIEKLQCTDPADRDILNRHWKAIKNTMDKLLLEGGAK